MLGLMKNGKSWENVIGQKKGMSKEIKMLLGKWL